MDVILALALGTLAGLIAGFVGGAHWSGLLFGRSIKREMDAGRLPREVAERIVTSLGH